jgi:hypothetical protein
MLPRRRVGTRSVKEDSLPAPTETVDSGAPVATASRSQRGTRPGFATAIRNSASCPANGGSASIARATSASRLR